MFVGPGASQQGVTDPGRFFSLRRVTRWFTWVQMRWSCRGLRSLWHVVGPPSAQLHVPSSCCRCLLGIWVSPKMSNEYIGFNFCGVNFSPDKSFLWSSWIGWPHWDQLRGCREEWEAQRWWEISGLCISFVYHCFPPPSPLQTCFFGQLLKKKPQSYLSILITKEGCAHAGVSQVAGDENTEVVNQVTTCSIMKPHKTTTLGAVHCLGHTIRWHSASKLVIEKVFERTYCCIMINLVQNMLDL